MKNIMRKSIVFVLLTIVLFNTNLNGQAASTCNLCPTPSVNFVDCNNPHDMYENFLCIMPNPNGPGLILKPHKDVVIHKKVTYVFPNMPQMQGA